MKGKSKSSHDLLKDDPHLSSVPAVARLVWVPCSCDPKFFFSGSDNFPASFVSKQSVLISHIFSTQPKNEGILVMELVELLA